MVKTLLIAGAGVLVVYLLVTRRSSGSMFALGPTVPNPIYPYTPPPTSGPGTRYQDANVWSALGSVAGAVASAWGKGGSSSAPSTSRPSSITPSSTNYGDGLMTPSFAGGGSSGSTQYV